MKAFNLSLFILIFFLVLNLISGFQEFSNFAGDNFERIDSDGDTLTLNSSQAESELETSWTTAESKLQDLKDDPSILDYFAVFLYGIGRVLMIILNTLRYLVFFADILMRWGMPVVVAGFVQLLIYLSYVFTYIDLFVNKGG